MEVTTKSMPYEAWKDNEYIEKLVNELKESGTNVIVGQLDKTHQLGAVLTHFGHLLSPPVAAVSNS